METMTAISKEMEGHWAAIHSFFSIQSEDEYNVALKRLDRLVDEIGTNEQHSLYELLDTLGTVIHAYEERHVTLPKCDGCEMLRYFMDEHGLSQSDLPEIGSQGVVSEILNGKRELNLRHIRILAERFQVSPSVFI